VHTRGGQAHQDAQQSLVFLLQLRQIRRHWRLCDAHQGTSHALKEVRALQVAVIVHEQVHQQLPVSALRFEAPQDDRTLRHVHKITRAASTYASMTSCTQTATDLLVSFSFSFSFQTRSCSGFQEGCNGLLLCLRDHWQLPACIFFALTRVGLLEQICNTQGCI
jgi:hypothetical protein